MAMYWIIHKKCLLSVMQSNYKELQSQLSEHNLNFPRGRKDQEVSSWLPRRSLIGLFQMWQRRFDSPTRFLKGGAVLEGRTRRRLAARGLCRLFFMRGGGWLAGCRWGRAQVPPELYLPRCPPARVQREALPSALRCCLHQHQARQCWYRGEQKRSQSCFPGKVSRKWEKHGSD